MNTYDSYARSPAPPVIYIIHYHTNLLYWTTLSQKANVALNTY